MAQISTPAELNMISAEKEIAEMNAALEKKRQAAAQADLL